METIINFSSGYGRVIVGQKVFLFGVEHIIVGFESDYIVFANLKPKSIDDARVKMYTDSEIEEFIANGSLKGYKK